MGEIFSISDGIRELIIIVFKCINCNRVCDEPPRVPVVRGGLPDCGAVVGDGGRRPPLHARGQPSLLYGQRLLQGGARGG